MRRNLRRNRSGGVLAAAFDCASAKDAVYRSAEVPYGGAAAPCTRASAARGVSRAMDSLSLVHRVTRVERSPTPGELQFVPWLLVAPSVLLARLGIEGRGLYALRPFVRGDCIGKYDGQQVGTPQPDSRSAVQQPAVQQLVQSGNVYLMVVRKAPKENVVIDGTFSKSFLQFGNDPTGTRRQASCQLTAGGYVRVLQEHIPAFNMERCLLDNARSEILLCYGDGFWAYHNAMGR